METKREVFTDVAEAYIRVLNGESGDLNGLIERYDNALDDEPGNVLLYNQNSASTFAAEPPRPSVHEIAMRLMAGDWACAIDGPNTSPQQCYMIAEMLYNAGTAWERNSKEGE